MKTYWIIGGGYFGQRTARIIRRKEANSKIIIVEKQSLVCKQLERSGFETKCMEGIRYLEASLVTQDHPDWIIPAIPVHVAFEWIKSKLTKRYNVHTIPIPHRLEAQLPNALQGDSGQRFISNADFICPDNCSEPEEICTYTGKPRPRILNDFLQQIKYSDFRSIVVCSQQLFAGIGGYSPPTLFEALSAVEMTPNPILLSTACRCHGVLDAFRISTKD